VKQESSLSVTGSEKESLLSAGFSVYLDLVRFGAAFVVFLAHARLTGLFYDLPMLDNLASQAVAAFFVLSGYVITATTDAGRGWRYYAVARAARIYSVMVPALLLSLALYAGSAIYVHFGGVTVSVPGTFSWWQLPVIVGFLGENLDAQRQYPVGRADLVLRLRGLLLSAVRRPDLCPRSLAADRGHCRRSDRRAENPDPLAVLVARGGAGSASPVRLRLAGPRLGGALRDAAAVAAARVSADRRLV